MPGSYEADKKSSNLISSLRSYRLKERPKYQPPIQSPETESKPIVFDTSDITSSSSNSDLPGSSQHSPSNNSSNQSYSPLGYRKYEISHTSQFILPCILSKIQLALKKCNFPLIDLPLKLSEDEYTKFKEIVLKQPEFAENWNSKVIETTSYVTCGSRELKVNREYITNLGKHIKRIVLDSRKKSVNHESESKATPSEFKPVKTYSRSPKTPTQLLTPKSEPLLSELPVIVSDSVSSVPSPTKGVMDEYEVFCEKEQNLRKLLDAFPGADIMEAQDILVKCNWDLDEAKRIAYAQPLRCSKKKALQYANSGPSAESLSTQMSIETNQNYQLPNAATGSSVKMAEEIVLDSSDDEFNSTVKKMTNKRINSTGKIQPAKRARKVLSSSDSEGDNSYSENQVFKPTHNLNSISSNSTSFNTSNNTSFSVSESIKGNSIKVTIKAVPNTSESSNETTSKKVSSIPNLPKGLSITQLGSDKPANNADVTSKVNTVNILNQKAEVITIPSHSKSNSSLNTSSSKLTQLVRVNMSNNLSSSTTTTTTANDKPDPGYTVHKIGTVVSLPAVSMGMSITPVATSTSVKSKINSSSEFQREKQSSRMKGMKGKRKKYAPSDDDDDEYGNDDIYDSEDSDIEENLTSAHSAVLKFFQEASFEELSGIPGCSKKKVEAIVNLRPFSSWVDLVQKLSNDKLLSTDMLNGGKKVLDMRNAINKLMAKCQQISLDMEDLVENLKEDRENSSDYVAKQPDLLNDELHLAPYQMLGLNWLLLLHNQEVNGILADEMGLGKTVQAISFLAYLKQIGADGPHLIVAPTSTLDNWKQELNRWWPTVSVLVYHGSQEQRRELRLQILNDEVEEFDVMITTYNMVTISSEDRGFFKRLEFHYVIFDEAHMLKNMASQRYQNLMRIRAPRRLLLTGTPLQNNLVELMSLLIFAMPHMFSAKTEQIKQMFSSVSKADGSKSSYERDRIDHAKRIMKPFVLRRLKREVLQDLPAKIDETRHCAMVTEQANKYKKLIAKFSAEVEKNKEDSTEKISSSGAGMMMQLRRAANHPLLLRNHYDDDKLREMSEEILKEPTHTQADPNLVFEDMSIMSDFELHQLCKQFSTLKPFILSDEHIVNSGKFKVLDELLPTLISKGHRVLLFSQFTMVLDIVEEYMHIRDYKYFRLDGQTPMAERQVMIDEFNSDPSISLFLLSTKAGGLGINLTAADTVILHDIDFNPYNDKQAEDRCHRVGQTKDVKVIRCVSENTIEENILLCAKEKLKLERDITEETEAEENESANVAKLLRDALGLKNSKS